ncbi:unnamed protein product [Vitrella brassicaformis CCMP3155]|uniref:Potassium channel tetramerisation-type BTB domain-containing protein n=2 Tax=Vitrella brassicaformis TaxID=1169539 RepID=A0A0G4EKY4_VITBC|nr:unnamed protein product [Vitrella brassicaformis CCMP3155]|eukprot:CEL97836.1 unnamed protein product [Vitrella brassicaformis CCMP3155]
MTSLQGVIWLDVAGKLLKVGRGTLLRYPDSFLAKLVDETWSRGEGTEDKPLFIESDPDLFPHIVAFLRHGKPIYVEAGVSRTRLLREFQYFCLPVADRDIKYEGGRSSVGRASCGHSDDRERLWALWVLDRLTQRMEPPDAKNVSRYWEVDRFGRDGVCRGGIWIDIKYYDYSSFPGGETAIFDWYDDTSVSDIKRVLSEYGVVIHAINRQGDYEEKLEFFDDGVAKKQPAKSLHLVCGFESKQAYERHWVVHECKRPGGFAVFSLPFRRHND